MNYGTQPPYSVPGQVPPPPQAAPQAYPPIAGYSASETPPAGYSYPVPPAAPQAVPYPAQPMQQAQGSVPVQPYLGYSQAAPVMPFYQAASAPMPASYAVPPAYPAPLYAPAPSYAIKAGRDPRLKGATRSLNRLGLVVLGQTGLAMLWGALFGVLMVLCGVNALLDSSAQLWLSAVAVPLSTALPFVIYLFAIHADLSDYLKFEKVGFVSSLLCVLAGLSICFLGNYPAMAVQRFFGMFGYEAAGSLTNVTTWQEFALEFFSTAIVVPVMEEFAFRGVLFSGLKKHGTAFAVVASALVFSFLHLDFSNVLFALIAGLVFGFLYAKTKNLWLTILIHAPNNGYAVFSSHADFFGDRGGMVLEIVFWALIVLGLVALVLLLTVKRKELFSGSQESYSVQPLRVGECVSCIVRSAMFWVLFSIMAVYTATLFF